MTFTGFSQQPCSFEATKRLEAKLICTSGQQCRARAVANKVCSIAESHQSRGGSAGNGRICATQIVPDGGLSCSRADHRVGEIQRAGIRGPLGLGMTIKLRNCMDAAEHRAENQSDLVLCGDTAAVL